MTEQKRDRISIVTEGSRTFVKVNGVPVNGALSVEFSAKVNEPCRAKLEFYCVPDVVEFEVSGDDLSHIVTRSQFSGVER